MGSTNPIKRHARQWKLLDCVSIAMMCAIFVVFMLVFTSLGDSLAASGQRYLDQADQADAASPGMQQQNPPFKFLPCLLRNSVLGLSLSFMT